MLPMTNQSAPCRYRSIGRPDVAKQSAIWQLPRSCWCSLHFPWILLHDHPHVTYINHTQLFYSSVDSVRDNPGEPVPEETFTHSHSSWSSIIPICFLHLLRSMASSLFNPCALESFSTISRQVFFGLPLGLAPSTSYSIHFFIQSLSSFCSTCPYHRNVFCCSTEIMSSNPSLPLNSLLIYALRSATSFSFLTGQVSLPCNILLRTQ